MFVAIIATPKSYSILGFLVMIYERALFSGLNHKKKLIRECLLGLTR